MKVILRLRQTVRTQQLILLCSQAEKRGEVSYIVCSSQQEALRIFQVANELESPISLPITYQEFLSGQYAGKNIKNFYIDNADRFLQSLTEVPIRAITMERDMTE